MPRADVWNKFPYLPCQVSLNMPISQMRSPRPGDVKELCTYHFESTCFIYLGQVFFFFNSLRVRGWWGGGVVGYMSLSRYVQRLENLDPQELELQAVVDVLAGD